MKMSEQLNELSMALVKAQAEFEPLSKSASGYGYKYVPFDAIISATRPILAKHGLAFVQLPTRAQASGVVGLTTRLIHASGQWLEDTAEYPVPDVGRSNDAQAYGAAITYARRYALSALLGLATDEDTDGTTKRSKPAPKPAGLPSAAFAPPIDTDFDVDYDSVPEIPLDANDNYMDVAECGAMQTSNGKPYIGFMQKGHKWPDVKWWGGRDALLQAAPWLIQTVTKEQLGEFDTRHEFKARVYYECKGDNCQYKNAIRFERL